MTTEPAKDGPESDRDNARVAIDEARGAGEEFEVVSEVAFALEREVLGYCSCQEEDDDNGGGDPEGAVEVRVAVKDVEEVCAR